MSSSLPVYPDVAGFGGRRDRPHLPAASVLTHIGVALHLLEHLAIARTNLRGLRSPNSQHSIAITTSSDVNSLDLAMFQSCREIRLAVTSRRHTYSPIAIRDRTIWEFNGDDEDELAPDAFCIRLVQKPAVLTSVLRRTTLCASSGGRSDTPERKITEDDLVSQKG